MSGAGRTLFDIDPEPVRRMLPPDAPDGSEEDRDLSPLLARMPAQGSADAVFDEAITALYTGQEVDWRSLDAALETWRPALDAIAARVTELEPGTLRVPQSFIRRTWRLLDVSQCEAHWQMRHGDRSKPFAILSTLLSLCRLIERAPAGDACLARHHAALITRSMVLASFRDPRLFHDAPAAALAAGRALLAETEPGLASFRAALVGESRQYVATMGAELYQRRGLPFDLSGGRALAIPDSAGERGLWLESAREQIHELMLAAVRHLSDDHARSLRSLRALAAKHTPSILGPERPGSRLWERLSTLARTQAFVNESLHECGLLLAHAHRIWVHNLQGHHIFSGMIVLEELRQRRGAYPASLTLAQLCSGHAFADPLTGGALRYVPEPAGYRLEIAPDSAALLSGK